MVSEVFGKHFRTCVLMEYHEFQFCLLSRLVLHRRVTAHPFTVHASAWLKILVRFARLSRLLLRLVSSPCHPCPPDAYATLTGIDYARDRLLGISI